MLHCRAFTTEIYSKGKREVQLFYSGLCSTVKFCSFVSSARAQKFYKAFSVFIGTTNVMGVMIIFGVETILDILVCTKQSSSAETAYKRYAETLLLIENLFKDSPEDPNSL